MFAVTPLLVLALTAPSTATLKAQVEALGQLTAAPATYPAEGFTDDDGLQAIFYDALPYHGEPTRVFAWLGFPRDATGKVPGVVLVHGGGGTAHREWVKLWNQHGFAALSIAVEGQTSEPGEVLPSGRRAWQGHAWAGPERVGIYGDSDQPLTDQWMYHALADTVLANSLLRVLPQVDPDKVGVCGISWGGVIVSTVLGIDPRFAFGIPIYGCGHLAEAPNQYGRALGHNQLYREVWDPMVWLDRATMPVLWFSWPADQHFPLNDQAACYHVAPGPHQVTILPGMNHGMAAGWRPAESYAFARSVVDDGGPWCRQVGARIDGGAAEVEFASAKPLDQAELLSTTDTGFTGRRTWHTSPATLSREDDRWVAGAELPVGTTAWFINVKAGDLTTSSDFQETGQSHG